MKLDDGSKSCLAMFSCCFAAFGLHRCLLKSFDSDPIGRIIEPLAYHLVVYNPSLGAITRIEMVTLFVYLFVAYSEGYFFL